MCFDTLAEGVSSGTIHLLFFLLVDKYVAFNLLHFSVLFVSL